MAGKPIFPMAFTINPNLQCNIYYVGFPLKWKNELLQIAKLKKADIKNEYALPTNTLKKMVNSWMEGIVMLQPLNNASNDERWLSSCVPFDEQRLSILFGIIKVWITATYVFDKKLLPNIIDSAKKLISEMDIQELVVLCSQSNVKLSAFDGTVSDEAYGALPWLAVNQLIGKKIQLKDTILELRCVGKNELMSQVLICETGRYSYVFKFTVQTTPPERRALLLCDMSIRRWIDSRKTDGNEKKVDVYLNESINAFILVSKNKYFNVPIEYSRINKCIDWKRQDKDCYNLYGFEQLPEISDLWGMVESGSLKYLLPYSVNAYSFVEPEIGTGVPVFDKVPAIHQIAELLSDYAVEAECGNRVNKNRIFSSLVGVKDVCGYESKEAFRKWVSSCIESDNIRFEIYGNKGNEIESFYISKLEEKIREDFGVDQSNSCLNISIEIKDISDIANALTDPTKQAQIDKSEGVLNMLGKTNKVVGCLCLIKDKKSYRLGRFDLDPKSAVRNGFGRSGRVVQFVVPEKIETYSSVRKQEKADKALKNKIEKSVNDLYRQLGIITLLDTAKVKPEAFMGVETCVGMDVFTQVEGINNKGRFLPVFVSVDLAVGRTRVYCDAFEGGSVNYREACFELANLYFKTNLEDLCKNASFSPAKQKLIELKNRYQDDTKKSVLFIVADGNTRWLWEGISDKCINSYTSETQYVPTEINVGTKTSAYNMSLKGSGIRIIRIRGNYEVPDYYTATNAKSEDYYASTAGLFKYGQVYWNINTPPNEAKYVCSLRDTKSQAPQRANAQKDMVEIYPLQLQIGDNPDDWVQYASALCGLAIQYDQATRYPLPLHLAENLKEYLFKI